MGLLPIGRRPAPGRPGRWSAFALLALVLATACAKPARDPDVVVFRDFIGDDQRRETIELRIGDQPPAMLEVRQTLLRKQRRVSVRIPDGIHSFAIRGEMETLDGKKVPIRGSGAIVRWEWLAQRFLRDAKAVGTAKAWEAIHRELAAKSATDLSSVALTNVHAVTQEELAEAEIRLGIAMPAPYRDAVLRFGSWSIGKGQEPHASLAHPRELLSVWDWAARHHGSELGSETPAWQELYESTRRDLVAGTAGGAVVFHGRPEARCKDGTPSFEIPSIDHEDFLYEDSDASVPYFTSQPANCENFANWHAWHSFTAAIGAITGPNVVVVTGDTVFTRDTEASTDRESIVYPESPWLLPWVEPEP